MRPHLFTVLIVCTFAGFAIAAALAETTWQVIIGASLATSALVLLHALLVAALRELEEPGCGPAAGTDCETLAQRLPDYD
jgi:hypothetical protein